jgi:hypothetical protein
MVSTVFEGGLIEPGAPGRLESAQVVWRRACDLVAEPDQTDRFAIALELSRAAGQEASAIRHALALGRTRLREDAGDVEARDGVRLLEDTITFLGPN